MSTNPTIPITWAQAAKTDIANDTAADYGGVNPTTFHENKVQQYWANHHTDAKIAASNKARIRRGAHKGGSVATEPDHITVSFRKGQTELGTVHVYTGRT